MCVRKNSLYIGLPLPSIPTELPPSPCSEKVHAFSDCHIYEYDFSKISNNYNGFTTSENARIVKLLNQFYFFTVANINK